MSMSPQATILHLQSVPHRCLVEHKTYFVTNVYLSTKIANNILMDDLLWNVDLVNSEASSNFQYQYYNVTPSIFFWEKQ